MFGKSALIFPLMIYYAICNPQNDTSPKLEDIGNKTLMEIQEVAFKRLGMKPTDYESAMKIIGKLDDKLVYFERLVFFNFVRKVFDEFKKRCLQQCSDFILERRYDIRRAYWAFFNPQVWKPHFVQDLANHVDQFLRAENIAKEVFIEKALNTYSSCLSYLKYYEEYFRGHITKLAFEGLMADAPDLDEKMKKFILFLRDSLSRSDRVIGKPLPESCLK